MFSEPASVFMSGYIVMRNDTLKMQGYKERKHISLLELMNKRRISGELETSRSYSKELDELFSKHESQSNLSRGPNK